MGASVLEETCCPDPCCCCCPAAPDPDPPPPSESFKPGPQPPRGAPECAGVGAGLADPVLTHPAYSVPSRKRSRTLDGQSDQGVGDKENSPSHPPRVRRRVDSETTDLTDDGGSEVCAPAAPDDGGPAAYTPEVRKKTRRAQRQKCQKRLGKFGGGRWYQSGELVAKVLAEADRAPVPTNPLPRGFDGSDFPATFIPACPSRSPPQSPYLFEVDPLARFLDDSNSQARRDQALIDCKMGSADGDLSYFDYFDG